MKNLLLLLSTATCVNAFAEINMPACEKYLHDPSRYKVEVIGADIEPKITQINIGQTINFNVFKTAKVTDTQSPQPHQCNFINNTGSDTWKVTTNNESILKVSEYTTWLNGFAALGTNKGTSEVAIEGNFYDSMSHKYIPFTTKISLSVSIAKKPVGTYTQFCDISTMSWDGKVLSGRCDSYNGMIDTSLNYFEKCDYNSTVSIHSDGNLVCDAPKLPILGMPQGAYTSSCDMATMKWDGVILEGDCLKPDGTQSYSKLNYFDKCKLNTTIYNDNGKLKCNEPRQFPATNPSAKLSVPIIQTGTPFWSLQK